MRDNKNITVFKGHARFVSPKEVEVGDNRLTADKFFINAGGRARIPDMPGTDQISYLTNSSMMDVDFLPPHLIVVGGSYIGLEFGQMFRRFGSEVTIIEMGSRLIGREDPDVSAEVRTILENEGVHLRLDAKCISFRKEGDKIAAGVDCQDGDREVLGSHVLLAVGRVPNTDDLGLDKVGVTVDKQGYIVVDDQLRTNVPGIWAIGDCNGKGAFTHTAYNDYEIVTANLLDNDPRRVTDRIPTYGLFIDPPLGRAGMTEAEAVATGRKILIGKRPMTRVSRAIEKGETQGFMKVLVDADSKFSARPFSPGGTRLAGHGNVMYQKAHTVIQCAVHIHPTVGN